MSDKKLFEIGKFAPKEITEWILNIHQQLSRMPASHGYSIGMLAYFISEEQLKVLTGDPAATSPLLLDHVVEPATTSSNTQYLRWQTRNTAFQKQQAILNSLAAAIIESLDTNARELINDDAGGGCFSRSAKQILEMLIKEYGTATEEALSKKYASLTATYAHRDGESIRAFLLGHLKVHRFLNDNKQPIPEFEKIARAKTAINQENEALFRPFWIEYNKAYPIPEQTFKRMAELIKEHTDALPVTLTAASAGYSASATTLQYSAADVAAAVAAGVAAAEARWQGRETAAAVADEKAPRRGRRPPVPAAAPAPPAQHRPPAPGAKYCWTHGWQMSHIGGECLKRREKHDAAATDALTGGNATDTSHGRYN
jgi:hypothetical protein